MERQLLVRVEEVQTLLQESQQARRRDRVLSQDLMHICKNCKDENKRIQAQTQKTKTKQTKQNLLQKKPCNKNDSMADLKLELDRLKTAIWNSKKELTTKRRRHRAESASNMGAASCRNWTPQLEAKVLASQLKQAEFERERLKIIEGILSTHAGLELDGRQLRRREGGC